MTDRELMQQALEALEVSTDWDMNATGKQARSIQVINCLRARLAQPEPEELGEIIPADEEQLKRIAKLVEPEPVAWYYAGSDVEWHSIALDADLDEAQKANCTPLYYAPPQREWQGLTDDERLQVRSSANYNQFMTAGEYAERVQTLTEAKLKEKNGF